VILVLATDRDAVSPWLASGLRAAGLAVELVTERELVLAPRWEHRVGRHGACVSIRLADGRQINGAGLRGVVNRVSCLAPDLFLHMRKQDRSYACAEMTALFQSWLSALPVPVLNPPQARGLAGAWRHGSEWAMLAARAGLGAGYRQPPGLAMGAAKWSLQVVGDSVVPLRGASPPTEVEEAAVELSRLSATPLLGLEFTEDWRLVAASPVPDLRLGGSAVVSAVARAFGGGRG
jgi:hypothetical protein